MLSDIRILYKNIDDLKKIVVSLEKKVNNLKIEKYLKKEDPQTDIYILNIIKNFFDNMYRRSKL